VLAELAIEAPDDAETAKWLQRAATHDNPRAQMLLGMSCCIGIQREINVASGLAWLQKAKAHPGFTLDSAAMSILTMRESLGLTVAQMQDKMEATRVRMKSSAFRFENATR
jgi:hypothetical protein